MTEAERNAYLAGFLDADGTFTISGNGSRTPRGRIEGYNTNHDVIRWCQTHYGGRIELERSRRNSLATSRWRVSNYLDMMYVIQCVEPYLIVKKARAILLRQFVTVVLTCDLGRRKYPPHALERMNSFRDTMRFLNARGADSWKAWIPLTI